MRLSYAGGSCVETHVLVDSGADYSMLPNDLAAVLRTPVESLRIDKTMGIGPEAVNVAWTEVLSVSRGHTGHENSSAKQSIALLKLRSLP